MNIKIKWELESLFKVFSRDKGRLCPLCLLSLVLWSTQKKRVSEFLLLMILTPRLEAELLKHKWRLPHSFLREIPHPISGIVSFVNKKRTLFGHFLVDPTLASPIQVNLFVSLFWGRLRSHNKFFFRELFDSIMISNLFLILCLDFVFRWSITVWIQSINLMYFGNWTWH